MTGPEQGFLLLTCQLADPERRPLTVAQFRTLAKKMAAVEKPGFDKEMEPADLMVLGYDADMAQRIIGLLAGKKQLREYLRRAQSCDCHPITRLNPIYPAALRKRLGLDSPGCLWAKGDITLLDRPGIALVGSRDLMPANQAFAQAAGEAAARQGYVLVSGNARGADRQAQDSCLACGGQVISVVADSLQEHPLKEHVLYLSLDDFDQPFSAQRALHRNRVIHAFGTVTLVAQCSLEKGGTWSGTTQNLRHGISPVCCFDDGSEAIRALMDRGGRGIGFGELENLAELSKTPLNFL